MEPHFSFYLVADTHYFEPALGAGGRKYDEYMKTQQMCLGENSAIVNAAFEKIKEDRETEIVIIPGDLVKDGEKESHLSFIRCLEELKKAGKKIYVTTALHDYNDNPRGYAGDKYVPVEGTKRSELPLLYQKFGFGDAIAFDEETYSYVAQIDEKVRMIAVNCDGENGERGAISERLLKWIEHQAQQARKDDCFVFAVNHYPILPACPVFEFIKDAQVRNYRNTAEFLADAGISIVFTGHMHIQSIKRYVSQNGNELYDVCTSALVGSPAKYRKVEFRGNNVIIQSLDVPDFTFKGKTFKTGDYCNRQFAHMVDNTVNSAVASLGEKNKFAGKIVAKAVSGFTLGTVGRLLIFKTDNSIKKIKLTDFAVEVILNLFSGEMGFVEGTAQYEFFKKVLSRLRFITNKVSEKLKEQGKPCDIEKLVFDSIGNNTGIDNNNAVINLKLN